MNVKEMMKEYLGKEVRDCTKEEIYSGLLQLVKEEAKKKESNQGKKKLYYFSAEFLIGKLLSNNLINLGIYEEVKELLQENDQNLAEIEELEPEPSLGNGGLGRLAACFLDSIASLGLNGDGVGLNYHYGLFHQKFENNLQTELPDPWLSEQSWLHKTEVVYPISFGGFSVNARMYDIDVLGYNNRTTKLHLFDMESVDDAIVHENSINFDKRDIQKNLTLFLYPDDSDEAGQILRVYQQYFMVSSGARLILDEARAKGSDLHDLYDYAVIQINDTHPTMVIPELIRLLMEQGICIDEAISIVSRMCAYTNHTILAEALEKWPARYLEKAVPQLMPIIYELNDRVMKKYADPSLRIIDSEHRVHMAHIDIHYSYSVNGVAYLHTEILKNSELKNFYEIYPEKFNNKTNGITFRRWLLHSNPELSKLIEELIGPEFKTDSEKLKELMKYREDETVLKRLWEVKAEKRRQLSDCLLRTQGIEVDPNSIFDIQVKRLHEYKRQQMNALYVIEKYFEIKEGILPAAPVTVIFGAKAAPAYVIAKDIIHLILCLQQIINEDPEVSPWLKVVMVENYNVTLAEKLIPAADIHEQISLASKEASGTSNMKFMLNGAVALGTMDGANVEIADLVGEDNIYIFGKSSDEVIRHYQKADYVSRVFYEEDPEIKRAVDFIVSDTVLAHGQRENLERLHRELIQKDWFMTLLDLKEYKARKDQAIQDHQDWSAWAKKMLSNIAMSGFFSSDRTIAQYNRDIWKLEE